MGTVNTKFKKTFVRKIPYEFKCEHCGSESGLRIAQIYGSAQYTKSGYKATLKPREQERLISNATENLMSHVNQAKRDVENTQLYDDQKFDSLCPHCGKHQSWGSNHSSLLVAGDLFTCIGGGAFCGIGIAVIAAVVLDSAMENPGTTAMIVGGIGGAIIAILLFAKLMKKDIRFIKMVNPSSKNICRSFTGIAVS